jgi:hypothetical protein
MKSLRKTGHRVIVSGALKLMHLRVVDIILKEKR